VEVVGDELKPPRQMVSQREKPSHVKHSPLVVTVSANEGTIGTSREKARYKSPYLACQMSVFFAPARYRVVKITRSSSEVVLRTMKHIVIYLGSDPSTVVIALRSVVWYRRWISVTRDEQRAREVHMVNGEMDLVPPV
jgi:hypothetical protein